MSMDGARRRRTGRRATRGFSLIEVLLALGIFSVVLLAILPLFSMATYGTQTARDLSRATALARTYVDKMRNMPYAQIAECPGTVGDPNNVCAPPAAEVAANAPFTVTWTVQRANGTAYSFPPNAPPSPDLKRVTVTVTCATCARQNLTVRMTTLIAARS